MASVTIAITRFAESDALVLTSLRAAIAQQGVEGEVLFLDQRVDTPLAEGALVPGNLALRIESGRMHGLSAARNRAMESAEHDLVLFLDADAVAEPDWALRLAEALAEPEVAVAGSRIMPGWPRRPPAFTRATAIIDQYSMLNLGLDTKDVGKVVGAGFGVDRSKLPPGFAFDIALGRRNGRLFGGEESDFCRRASLLALRTVYVGGASVTHLVEPERLRLSWIVRRMFYAGYGRAAQGGAPAPSRRLTLADWLFAPLYLPPYVLGWAWRKWVS